MARCHTTGSIIPIGIQDITQIPDESSITTLSGAELSYREDIGLCSRVFMSRDCPLFLQKRWNYTGTHYSEPLSLGRGCRVFIAFSISVTEYIWKGLFDNYDVIRVVDSATCMNFDYSGRRTTLVRRVQDDREKLFKHA